MENLEYMKKIVLLLIGAVICCTMRAQVLEENESAQVYYSPETTLVLDFVYVVETQERGQFADFAEELMGITEFVNETATTCTLKDVHVGTSTSTDYTRPHKVSNEAGFPMLLTINDKGLLTGYNIPVEEPKPAAKKERPAPKSASKNKPGTPVVPYPEEVLKASNPRAQAFEVAKQIFHIRETRMYLLNGEVEHSPADGKSMELVLNALDEQELALTELFTGKKCKKQQKKTVRVEPNDKRYLLYFSDENGFTEGDNIDADTIEVKMICQWQVKQAVDPKDKKKATELTQIVYNVPGTCAVNVLYKGRSWTSRTLPVAQFGVDVALPKSLFTGKALPKITFSEKTGNIVTIAQ